MSIASLRSLSRLLPLAALALAPSLASAEEAGFEWQKRKVALIFVAPRLGKHTLNELQIGETWRLGAGGITTMMFDTALVAGDDVVAPGTYRVNLARPGAQDFALTIEGAGTWTLADAPDFTAPGTFAEAKKPNEKLEIVCSAAKEQPDAELRALTYEIQYGAPIVTVPVAIVGTQSQAVRGFTLDAFKVPAELLKKRLEGGKTTAVASLVRKNKPKEGEAARLNVLLAEKEVTLLPAATPPTENRGFGAVPKPDKASILRGTVQWAEANPPAPHFTVEKATIEDDGTLHMTVVAGARRGTVSVPTTRPKN